jgi:Icc-related predicted phosphoesterase
VRLFFATDVHGSEVCWSKFLNAARHYHAEGDAVWAGEYQVASVGWTNRTPWDTYGSGLDLANLLDETMTLVHAGRITVPVGSTAVRDAIEQHQPILSLHGHVHEARGFARIGRTLAINPGSSYGHGDLLGAIVDLSATRKPRFMLVDG